MSLLPDVDSFHNSFSTDSKLKKCMGSNKEGYVMDNDIFIIAVIYIVVTIMIVSMLLIDKI